MFYSFLYWAAFLVSPLGPYPYWILHQDYDADADADADDAAAHKIYG